MELGTVSEAALRFAALGIPVFPLLSGSKLPAVTEFPAVASTDPQKIRLFFVDPVLGLEQPYNVGLLMRGFIGIDIDTKEGRRGLESLEMFELCGLEFPKTLTQHTPTGGIHYVYSLPKNVAVRNSAESLAPGIDVRGGGGYLVGGASTVPKGSYRTMWADVALAPQWLLDRLSRASAGADTAAPASERPPLIVVDENYAQKRGADLVSRAPGATQGSRDSRAYELACQLKNLGVYDLNAFSLLDLLWAPRCDPPFPSDELITPVENAYRYAKDKAPINAPEFEFSELPVDGPPAEAKTKPDPILELNDQFAFVLSGSSHHILFETTDRKGSPIVKHLKEEAFHARLAARTKKIRGKDTAISRLWMKSPARRTYDGFCFAPGQECDARYYNLWKGFSFQPADLSAPQPTAAREGLALFLEHSLRNICQGDAELHEWLISYFAHIFQRPWEKPGVALVFRGKKGVGKNALMNHIGRLLGSHFILAANKRYLVGNFNAHLEGKIAIVLDEAFWSGEKEVEGILKDLITGNTHLVERKGKDPYEVDSCLRTVILGNEKWLVPATEDERRFAVFNVGDERLQDIDFFERMRVGMESGGYPLLLRYLLDYDISKTKVRVAPNTVGLYEQKAHTMSPFERWWYDCLHDGAIKGSTFLDGWPTTITRDELRDSYWAYKQKHRISGWGETSEEFGRLFKAIGPEISAKQRRVEGKIARIYELPGLEECRRVFCQRMKHQINWEEE